MDLDEHCRGGGGSRPWRISANVCGKDKRRSRDRAMVSVDIAHHLTQTTSTASGEEALYRGHQRLRRVGTFRWKADATGTIAAGSVTPSQSEPCRGKAVNASTCDSCTKSRHTSRRVDAGQAGRTRARVRAVQWQQTAGGDCRGGRLVPEEVSAPVGAVRSRSRAEAER